MDTYIESEMLELKERYTDTIAKEIVSFLNGNGGTILIGVKDNGVVVGVFKGKTKHPYQKEVTMVMDVF